MPRTSEPFDGLYPEDERDYWRARCELLEKTLSDVLNGRSLIDRSILPHVVTDAPPPSTMPVTLLVGNITPEGLE